MKHDANVEWQFFNLCVCVCPMFAHWKRSILANSGKRTEKADARKGRIQKEKRAKMRMPHVQRQNRQAHEWIHHSFCCRHHRRSRPFGYIKWNEFRFMSSISYKQWKVSIFAGSKCICFLFLSASIFSHTNFLALPLCLFMSIQIRSVVPMQC